MTTLNEMLRKIGVTKKDVAQIIGVTRPTLSGLAQRGIWPANAAARERLHKRLGCWLLEQGFSENEVGEALGNARLTASDAASRAPKVLQWGVDSPAKQKTPQSADFDDPHVRASPALRVCHSLPPEGAAGLLGAARRKPDFAAPQKNVPQSCSNTTGAALDKEVPFYCNKEDYTMLLKNEVLTQAAARQFKLPRSPFLDDINSHADVFSSADIAYARNVLLDCAVNQGFVALIGESGSGKTTMREELEARLAEFSRPVVVIKPYVLEMEPTERYGRVLKSGQISEAIISTLAPGARIRVSMQARSRQVHDLLTASQQAGNANLLIIEEAHRLPITTLRHLKGFMEMKNGLRRLLGVVLIGQPELHALLNEHRADVREIVQRCAKIEMLPLDAELENYIRHKFARVGVDAAQMFSQPIYDAIRARLIYRPRNGSPGEARSICYPLVVNNLLVRALNAAARVGMALSADVIKEC